MKSLDFMIIGVQKAGTTALSHFLAQHPEICMASGKEVHLFDAADYSNNWSVAYINEVYSSFFPGADESLQWGEATPIYLYWPEIIPELKRYNPSLKLIVILRDPIDRAISQYEMEVSRGNEALPLWRALLNEPTRLAESNARKLGGSHRCHSYMDRGLYVHQLDNLRKYFDDKQILILDNAELKIEHEKTLQNIYQFLEISTENIIKQEHIFNGNYKRKHFSLARWLIKKCLWLRFYFANRQLKKTLLQMGYSPKWPWLR